MSHALGPMRTDLPKRRKRVDRSFGASILIATVMVVSACSGSTAASPVASVTAAPTAAASAPAPSASAAATIVGNGKKQLAWAIGLNDLPIIDLMKKEMTAYAGKQGWEVLYDSGTQGAIQPMLTSLQAWITAGVPAITALPFEPSAFEPFAKQAVDKGLIFLDYAVETDTKHGVFGFGPCDAAKLVAAGTVEWIKENDPKAEVLITSNIANPNVKCKWEDVKATIEAETDATVVAIQDGNNPQDALKVAQAVLRAHPNLSVAIGTNDDAAVGLAQAFKAAGKDPKKTFIVGFDGAQANLEEIQRGDGFIDGTAAINLVTLARLIVDKSIEFATTGQPSGPPGHFDVPVDFVVHGDPKVDEILADYAPYN